VTLEARHAGPQNGPDPPDVRAYSFLLVPLMACSTPHGTDSGGAIAHGISAELAASRIDSIRDLRYELAFDLRKVGPDVPARAKLTFELAAAGRVVLDFAGEHLVLETQNGARPRCHPRACTTIGSCLRSEPEPTSSPSASPPRSRPPVHR
jgi:hypothetical protein